jgi:hypothetical protein
MKRLRPLLLFLCAALVAAAARAAFDWKSLKKPASKAPTSKAPVGVAAVRGLDEPGNPGDLNARAPEAVAWLEERSQKISGDDVRTFIVTGGLEP